MNFGRRPKSIGQALIDLTPLLDVIFILFMVVLCLQDESFKAVEAREAEADNKVVDAMDYVDDADAKLGTMQAHLDSYSEVNDYVNIITVYASYQPSNRKHRTIHIAINSEEPFEIELNPSNTSKAWQECKDKIQETVNIDPAKPSIISIENEKMLYRDENSIIDLCTQIQGENVFLKNRVGED